MLDLTEKTLKATRFIVRIIRVRTMRCYCQTVEHGWREVVDHPGGVGILALTTGAGGSGAPVPLCCGPAPVEIPAGKAGEREKILCDGAERAERGGGRRGGKDGRITGAGHRLPRAATPRCCTCTWRRD